MAFDPNDPEAKQAIKAAVDAAIEEATGGLKAKNQELLGKIKKLQKDAAIDPAEFQALEAENEKLQADLKEANKAAKTATTQAEQAQKALETEAGFVSKLLVDNGLTDALLKAGVKPELSKAVKAMLAGQVTLKTEGSERIAILNDKPLSEAVKEWASSDEGKHFVAAPANQGGGANGGSNNGGGDKKTITSAIFDGYSDAQKMSFIKEGGQVVNS